MFPEKFSLPSQHRTRRHFLSRTALSLGLLPGILQAARGPGLVSRSAPTLPGGVMTGDVIGGSAVIWSRTSQPARLMLEVSTTESFARVRRIPGPEASAHGEFTVKRVVDKLPPGQKVFYRAWFESRGQKSMRSERVIGSFVTPPRDRKDIFFAWSGDTAGQGFGIDLDRGGMRTYETIRRMQPDFFVHSGDTIYADNPLSAELKLEDEGIWKNVMTEAKSKVAESVSEFRGNHFYNQLDEQVRRFNAEVPVYYQWDDHEVLNNWSPGKILEDKRYQEKDATVLARRSRQAFFDCLPIRPHRQQQIYRKVSYGPLLDLFFLDLRTYRARNSPNRQNSPGRETDFFGREQLNQLKHQLKQSRARWKIFCSDMPIGVQVKDGAVDFENCTNGDGPALGRELEMAELLKFLRDEKIRNTLWLTADVHYCASMHYDPARAVFQDFDPFWEFISGPLHAGTFGPGALDNTFGPERRFFGTPPGMKGGQAPSAGYQFFGTVRIHEAGEALTVAHWNVAGEKLWETVLEEDNDR